MWTHAGLCRRRQRCYRGRLMAERVRVLFVCMGNICRSPMMEILLRERLDAVLAVDSTAAFGRDREALAAARRHRRIGARQRGNQAGGINGCGRRMG